MTHQVDLAKLQQLASKLHEDAQTFEYGINPAAMRSIAGIIEQCIGAPLMHPTRLDGAREADRLYPGDPSQRLAFNDGVRWILEQYRSEHEKITAQTTLAPVAWRFQDGLDNWHYSSTKPPKFVPSEPLYAGIPENNSGFGVR